MQSFKIKMFLSLSLFVILLDLYLWQAIKVLIKKHPIWYQKTIKWVYWSIPILIITAFFLMQFNSTLAANRLVRTYLMGFFFIIYGSKLVAFLFIVVDDIKRLFIWFWHGIERKVLKQKKQAEEEEMEERMLIEEDIILGLGLEKAMEWIKGKQINWERDRLVNLAIGTLIHIHQRTVILP